MFVAQLVKNPPAMWEMWVQSLGWKIPWRRERLSTPVFWPGQFHGLYSPWGHKEFDTTEQFSLFNVMFTKSHPMPSTVLQEDAWSLSFKMRRRCQLSKGVSSASFRCLWGGFSPQSGMSSFQKAAPTRNIQKGIASWRTCQFSTWPHLRLQASSTSQHSTSRQSSDTPATQCVQNTSRVTWTEVICGVDILRDEEGRFTSLVHAPPPTHMHSQVYTPTHAQTHHIYTHTPL